MALGGVALRFGQTVIRGIQLLASILVLGVFSYFLAVLSDHHLPIAERWKAVEGMSGAAVLYTIFGVVLTLCLGGISFFAFLAVVLDLCFVGCFVAIAIITRHGSDSCSGYVRTPLGNGQSNSKAQGYGQGGFGFGNNENVTYLPNLGRACKLEKAVFAVSIVNVVLFILSAIVQVGLVRHHKREKRYGPSPSNNYTSGFGRRPFWKRNRRSKTTRDAEIDAAGAGVGAGLAAEKHHGIRPSHETGYTGSTVAPADNAYGTTGYTETNPYGNTGGYNTTHYGDGYTTNTNTHTHTTGTTANF